MSFKVARSGFIGIVLILFGLISAFAQGIDAKVRAKEVLDQARAALGGDAALNAVQSLFSSGDFRSGLNRNEISGEVQLDILFPDKLMRTMKYSPAQTMKVTSVEVMNGSQVWTDSQMKQSSPLAGSAPMSGGGMGRSGGRGGGGMGRGGGRRSTGGAASGGGGGGGGSVNLPAPNLREGMDNQQMRSDFSCLIMALLLRFSDSSQAEYEGDADIESAKTDSLKITDSNGSVVSLFIDQKSHRPIMAAYKASMTDKAGAEEKQTPSSESEMSQIQIYFSEYKAISEKGFSDIWLPHQITKTRNGQTVEDMHMKKFQLNPHLNPKQFEKKN